MECLITQEYYGPQLLNRRFARKRWAAALDVPGCRSNIVAMLATMKYRHLSAAAP